MVWIRLQEGIYFIIWRILQSKGRTGIAKSAKMGTASKTEKQRTNEYSNFGLKSALQKYKKDIQKSTCKNKKTSLLSTWWCGPNPGASP